MEDLGYDGDPQEMAEMIEDHRDDITRPLLAVSGPYETETTPQPLLLKLDDGAGEPLAGDGKTA